MYMTKRDIERMESQRGYIMREIMDIYSFEILDTMRNIININDRMHNREKWPDDMEFDEYGCMLRAKPHEAVLTLLKSYYLNESDLVKDFAILFDKLGKMYDVAPEDFLQAIREKLD